MASKVLSIFEKIRENQEELESCEKRRAEQIEVIETRLQVLFDKKFYPVVKGKTYTDVGEFLSVIAKKRRGKSGTYVDGRLFDIHLSDGYFKASYDQLKNRFHDLCDKRNDAVTNGVDYEDALTKAEVAEVEYCMEASNFIRDVCYDLIHAYHFINKQYDSTINMIKRTSDRLNEKLKNLENSMKNDIPPALKEVQEKYENIFFKDFKHVQKEVKKLQDQYPEQEDFIDAMKKKRISMFYVQITDSDDSKLRKEAAYQAFLLVLNLYHRVVDYVGTIESIEQVRIADNGELNALIRGPKRTVVAYTIVAGGYNIQCAHYRVLVKPHK